MTRLVALGDSHARYYAHLVPGALVVDCGAVTMYRAGRLGIESVVPGDAELFSDDHVVLSFGEIDCRCHVERIAAQRSSSPEAVVDDLVARFLETAAPFCADWRLDAAVLCVPPPGRPSIEGDLPAQVHIRKYMNAALSASVAGAGLRFVDFYGDYADADGALTIVDAVGNHIHQDHVGGVLEAIGMAFGTTYGVGLD